MISRSSIHYIMHDNATVVYTTSCMATEQHDIYYIACVGCYSAATAFKYLQKHRFIARTDIQILGTKVYVLVCVYVCMHVCMSVQKYVQVCTERKTDIQKDHACIHMHM